MDDADAWGVDIATLLRNGEVDYVLWLLSDTWTSLGYGMESNIISPALPDIYAEVLEEELAIAQVEDGVTPSD